MKLDEAYIELLVHDEKAREEVRQLRAAVRRETRGAADDGGRAAKLLSGRYKNEFDNITYSAIYAFRGLGRVFMRGGAMGLATYFGIEAVMSALPKLFGGGEAAVKAREFGGEMNKLNLELFESERRLDAWQQIQGRTGPSLKAASRAAKEAREQYEQFLSYKEKDGGAAVREKMISEIEEKINVHPERYEGELGMIRGPDPSSKAGRGEGAAGRATTTWGVLKDTVEHALTNPGVSWSQTAKRRQLAENIYGENLAERQRMLGKAEDAEAKAPKTGKAELTDIASFADKLTASASSIDEKDEEIELLRQIRNNTAGPAKDSGGIPPAKGPM